MRSRSMLIILIAILVGVSVGSVTTSNAAPPSPSPTQIVGQLEISGLKGDGGLAQFPGAVEIRSFDISASKSGVKDPKYQRLQVAAAIDSASVGLLERLSLGTTIPTVKLSLTAASDGALTTFKSFTLTNAKVTTLREFASGQGSDLAMIEVAFSYRRISVEFRGQNSDGSSKTPIGFCWNLTNASEC